MARRDAVVGADVFNKKLKAIADETDDKTAAQSLRAAMKPMLNEARQNAPVGDEAHRTYKGRLVSPGFLRRNITLKKLKGVIGYSLASRKEAFYGGIIETGFRGKKGDPWLGPAYETEKNNVVGNFKREMAQRIDRKAKQIRSRHK